LPSVSSYSEFQWRRRIQFIVLPLQQKKTDRDKNAPSNRDDEGGGYQDKSKDS
jgi:hypothetical protein